MQKSDAHPNKKHRFDKVAVFDVKIMNEMTC
jgi:hypothetical protein